MSALVFDIETDGLIPEMTKVHCLVTVDADNAEVKRYVNAQYEGYESDGSIEDGIAALEEAGLIIGHNIVGFDIPALRKLYGSEVLGGVTPFDTSIAAPVANPDVKTTDMRSVVKAKRLRREPMPGKLIGRHSLAAWGWRLGNHKAAYGDGRTDWSTFDQDMLDYCVQDVRVNLDLYRWLEAQDLSDSAVELEHQFSTILRDQQAAGFAFDVQAGEALAAATLKRKYHLETELRELFPPKTITYLTPKKQLKREKIVEFNPTSRQQVAERLMEKGWEPSEWTPKGKPKVDGDILRDLPYPEAQQLADLFDLQKQTGLLVDGSNAWLSKAKDGRIHGAVRSIGTPHSRCAHFSPNLAQVPSGPEFRKLFGTRGAGWSLVGCDAAGIQLRMLAHYLAAYDGGAYTEIVTTLDPHERNREIAGLATRSEAKTLIYSVLFGAGDELLGTRLGKTKAQASKVRKRFVNGLPGLKELMSHLEVASKRGYLVALDGRRVPLRSGHVALNYLLSSAEAVVMKRASVIMRGGLTARGLTHGEDFVEVAHVHDEYAVECRDEVATVVAEVAAQSIVEAGEYYKLRCPQAGDARVGKTWADVH